MSPLQALQSATVNAASALGKEKDLGSIEPGFHADIIAVKGNPLNDTNLLAEIPFVMKAGVVYKAP